MTRSPAVTESVTDQPPPLGTGELSGGGTSAPGRIRTSDQQLRRLLLYPPELRARGGAATTYYAAQRLQRIPLSSLDRRAEGKHAGGRPLSRTVVKDPPEDCNVE